MTHPLTGVAYEIYTELDSPEDPTTSQIFWWLGYNAGKLNEYISTFYEFDGSEYEPMLQTDEKSIIKALYFAKYYTDQGRKSLISATANSVISLKDDQSSVRFVNPKEIARAYRDLSKDKEDEAYLLSNLYKHNGSGPREPEQTWSGHWE